ncbi:MAG TPA: hypothetical protein VMM60_08490, partial [Ilumatobacter sp.]|nr:hypothetical protein [Ilumatobacter sp.]
VRITDTLSSPGFATLPSQLTDVLAMVGDVSKRLGPLTQLAENAGGLFGGLRLPGMGGGRPSNPPPRPTPVAHDPVVPAPPTPATAPAPVNKAPAKKTAAKKAPAKKATAKKTTAKKTSAK